MTEKPSPPRRRRGALESLGSVVLGFEAVVVFLAGLAVFGLSALPASIPSWWAIIAGTVLALLMIALSAMLRRRWAVAAGWTLQVVLALGAFLVPAIGLVALIFGGMWAYATIKGRNLDRINAKKARNAELNGD